MVKDIALILGGLIVLTAAADKLVEGACALARRLGLTPLLVGLTVVAFGTSAPELVVSLQSGYDGNPGIAVGNVVGSNIFNAAFILGLSALICPIGCSKAVVRRDVPIMIGVALVNWVVAVDGIISRIEGLVLFVALIAYIYFSYVWSKSDPAPDIPPEALTELKGTLGGDIGRIALALVGLVASSKALLIGSVNIARSYGVSDEVIGLTLIAAGTSLPELATSIVAAWKGNSDIAVGNVVGSNIFNVLGILGIAAGILPLTVSKQMAGFDIPVMVVVCLGCLPIMRTGWKISRLEGGVLFAAYIGYTYALYLAHH